MRTDVFEIRNAIAVVGLCLSTATSAAPRQHYSDQEVVSRADLIVVGRMREGSLKLVLQPASRNAPLTPESPDYQAPSWDHHLELLISEVLKGQLSSTSVVVNLDYGLTAVADGYFSNQFMIIEFGGNSHPKGEVLVVDTGSSTRPAQPVTGDIRTNQIWLLRRERIGSEAGQNMLGIYDPEDIQPIAKKEELLRLLKPARSIEASEERSQNHSGRCSPKLANGSDLTSACMSNNLTQIYLTLRRGNILPTSLNELGAPVNSNLFASVDTNLFVCPTTGHRPGHITDIEKWTDYIYIGNPFADALVGVPLIISPPENHDGKLGFVLFSDGVVSRLPSEEVRLLIRNPFCLATNESLGNIAAAKTRTAVSLPDRLRSYYPPGTVYTNAAAEPMRQP